MGRLVQAEVWVAKIFSGSHLEHPILHKEVGSAIGLESKGDLEKRPLHHGFFVFAEVEILILVDHEGQVVILVLLKDIFDRNVVVHF